MSTAGRYDAGVLMLNLCGVEASDGEAGANAGQLQLMYKPINRTGFIKDLSTTHA